MNPRVLISLSAITQNYLALKQQNPTKQLYAVVKTNAYNHGVAHVAKQLHMADGFCVATLEEGVALRSFIPKQRICVMHGANTVAEWSIVDQLHLDSCLHTLPQLESFQRYTFKRKPTLWIKINTGMNRLGFTPQQAEHIIPQLSDYDCILFSHYACSEDLDHPANASQDNQIQAIHRACPYLPVSVANSATLNNSTVINGDIIRVGIALYGQSPQHLDLKPALTFEAPVIAIHTIQKGQSVGYGQRWSAPYDGFLAVIRAGYADGYPRILPDGTSIAINGALYPLAGRISMDLSTIFLGKDSHNIVIGDWAELWGNQISLIHVAERAQSIPYELLCNLGERVERFYQ